MSDIQSLMDTCFERGASDLHLSVDRAPVLRLGGHLVELDGEGVLVSDDLERMVAAIVPERNRRELEEIGSTDFGLSHGDKCRFRVSVLTQKGSRGIVMRLIPHKLLSLEQIGLPESVRLATASAFSASSASVGS